MRTNVAPFVDDAMVVMADHFGVEDKREYVEYSLLQAVLCLALLTALVLPSVWGAVTFLWKNRPRQPDELLLFAPGALLPFLFLACGHFPRTSILFASASWMSENWWQTLVELFATFNFVNSESGYIFGMFIMTVSAVFLLDDQKKR